MNIFIGRIEDLDDPNQDGRYRVRIYSYHPQDTVITPTEDLFWSQTVTEPNNALLGKGVSPNRYKIGTMVFGCFLDSPDNQYPIIMGSIFGKGDINPLVKGIVENTAIAQKRSNVKQNVPAANGSTWNEPQSPYDTQYPFNVVEETESGHLFEKDDTPGAERLHVYHKSGSCEEIFPNGTKVTRVVQDNYEIISGSNFVLIEGTCNITVNGNCNVKSDNAVIQANSLLFDSPTSRFTGNVQIDGNQTISGNSSVTGNQTVGGNNTVSGTVQGLSLQGATVTSSGALTGGSLTIGGTPFNPLHRHIDSEGGTTTPPID